MRKAEDLTGKRFGRLVVVERAGSNRGATWLCQCDCGNQKVVRGGNLRNGNVKSCGCLNRETMIDNLNKGNRSLIGNDEMIGKRFGKLEVIGKTERKDREGLSVWKCRCNCGNICYIPKRRLLGGTKSCGCLKTENKFVMHGKSKERIHKEWRGILHRCKNPSASHYENYGGRGITVCEEWKGTDGFINFYNWSMKNGYADNLTLDRKDNDKGYSPDNCRWITHMENCHNRGARKDSQTGYAGVQIVKLKTGSIKYRVSITANYKRINLGYYENLEEAILVRKTAEEKYWGKKEGDA